MKILATVNELGNYITEKLAFLLKEKAKYSTSYKTDKSSKYRRVKKHTAAYFNHAHVRVEYSYQFREIRIVHYDIIEIALTIDFVNMPFYKTEYIDSIIENFTNMIPAI